MMEKKQEQAIRIYEALSGVDPDLLQRSEKEKKEQKVVSLWRFTRPLAACLVLFAAGGLCLVTLRGVGGVNRSATNSEQASFISSNQPAAVARDEVSSMAEEAAFENKEAEEADYSAGEQAEEEMVQEAWPADINGENSASAGSSVQESKSASDYSKQLWSIVTDQLKTKLNNKEGMAMTGPEAQSDAAKDRSAWKEDGGFQEFCLGKTMRIRLGEEELCLDLEQSEEGRELLWCLAHFELSDYAEEIRFDDGITLEILDENGNSVQVFAVFEQYLKLGDDEGIFEVTDEEYDYEELLKEIKDLLGE